MKLLRVETIKGENEVVHLTIELGKKETLIDLLLKVESYGILNKIEVLESDLMKLENEIRELEAKL